MAAAKRPELENRFNNPQSSFATSDPDLHRIRRGALNPFFSKRAIAERAEFIQRRIDVVCQRLKTEFQNRDRVLVVNDMFGCWVTDIITEYCFERRYDFIQEPDFKATFVQSSIDLIEGVHWLTQFPWIATVTGWVPEVAVGWIDPRMKSALRFSNVGFVRLEVE